MSNSFPNRGAMPSQQGYALSSSTGAAAAQQGMVRIHRGGEVRYVWPVHLAGWLSSGWRTGEENRSPQGAADAIAAVVISEGPGQDTLLPAPKVNPPASTDPSLTPVAESDEPGVDPIDAHLPTNLLDLDLEEEPAPLAPPQPPMAPSSESAVTPDANHQGDSERNDAVSASFAAADQVATASVGVEAPAIDALLLDAAVVSVAERPAADVPSPEAPVDSTPEGLAPEVPSLEGVAGADKEPATVQGSEAAAPPATEPFQEPAPQPAPARRGRPRKVRPEAQAEPAHEPAAVTPAQEQASPSQDSSDQQDAATVLTSEGDDPFGLDPLL